MQSGAPADRGPPVPRKPVVRPVPPPINPEPQLAWVDEDAPRVAPKSAVEDPPPPPPNAWTVARILDWTTGHLKTHGSSSPRLDAELLLAHARKCPRIQLYVQHSQIVPDDQRAIMRDLVQRRAAAEPVAYLIGHREFFGLDFEVNRDTLIPRPETETLVLEALDLAKSLKSPRVLDVGTGTGCIAISLAKQNPALSVMAVDMSSGALAVAQRNVARHQLQSRVTLLQSDLFAVVPADARFDLVVSNPPYIGDEELPDLPPDVRLHEPHSALLAGPKGLSVIARLVPDSVAFLDPEGWLLMEIDPDQVFAVTGLLKERRYRDIRTVKDAAGQWRVVIARRPVG